MGRVSAGADWPDRLTGYDWSATPLGPVRTWPAELVSASTTCLRAPFPMIVFWGRQFAQVYNDAYHRTLGPRHPASLGQPLREWWPELWHAVEQPLRGVLGSGEPAVSTDLRLTVDRDGRVDEGYFTFVHTPIRDPSGRTAGVCCAIIETTERVVGERRLRTLHQLAAGTAAASSPEAACRAAAVALDGDPDDVPFAMFYLLEPDGEKANLVATSGMPVADFPEATAEMGAELAKTRGFRIGVDDGWPLAEALGTGKPLLLDSQSARGVRRSLVLPMNGPEGGQPPGVLVLGINPRAALDDPYRHFLDQVAERVTAALDGGRAYQRERRRGEALVEVDRVKTVFFANLSHEFRTPLMLLLGPLEEALAEPQPLPEPQRERVQVAHRSALRLLKLVDTLLHFSRLEAGRARASYQPVDLAELTTELASMFRSAIERAGLRLAVDCPALREPVYVDPQMWETVVLNLVSNAFKYTFAGRVEVLLREGDDAATLTVRDTGVGIPTEQIPHLFERFHRVPGVHARTHEGSGIGLSLVSELVMLHGGTVSVTSELGRGSAFTVRIPFGVAHLPLNQIDVDRPVQPGAQRAGYLQEALRWLPDAVPARPEPGSGAGHAVVLVADDNADMRAHLKRALSPHWTVRLAADGEAALRMARTSPPDIILIDVMMPGLDGFSLLRELRDDPRTRELPVIMLTARAGQESTVQGLAAGADDYLVKPFTTAELIARVHTHLRTARIRQRATMSVRSLANASHALSTSLDVGELVDVLTTLVVPQWSDECVVWLRERTRTGEWRLLARTSPRRDGAVHRLIHADQAAAALSLGVARAIEAGRPFQARLAEGNDAALTVPLRARGHQVGAVTVARRGGAPWRPPDLEHLTDLARRFALALDNASRYEAERDVAATLQRSLLPAELPTLPGLDLAARYQPGGQGTSVGGDWYDAFPLPDGRLALAIGDVMGRGVRAAAIMGQLRAALRGYALEGLPPAELLTRLDAFVEASGEPHLSTCLYATYHPVSCRLSIAAAGHLPPLVVAPDGTSGHLALPVGLPLGVGAVDDITYADHELVLPPGSLLLLYTDGLIETREQSVDAGMRAMEAATGRRFASADAACEHILTTMGTPAQHDDDITILAVYCGHPH